MAGTAMPPCHEDYAGVSEANPRNIAINECAPVGGRGALATPAGVRIVVPLLPGGSLRSPPANFLSPRWGEIRYRICAVFMKSWTKRSQGNEFPFWGEGLPGFRGVCLFIVLIGVLPADAMAARLTPEAIQARDKYLEWADKKVERELTGGVRFLIQDQLSSQE